MAKNPERKVQALACKLLGKAVEKSNPKLCEELTKTLHEKYGDIYPDLSVGKMAPEIISYNADGKEVKLSDLRGKVVVLDIWATWCPHCRAMIPHEREMVERYKDKPFAIVSISFDDEKKTLTDFLKKEKMPWRQWWHGTSGGIAMDDSWDIEYFPTIYVLGPRGVIRFRDVNGADLDKAVEKLLNEMGGRK